MDADYLYRKINSHNKQRFPNLACMKISGHFKRLGYDVEFIDTDPAENRWDEVFISKVFTDTQVPDFGWSNIHKGGTGFYFDKAEPLPYQVEHGMPDYDLYPAQYLDAEFHDASIGYLTRGCFRQCGFCVNQKYSHVFKASELDEFYDPARRYIALLDDNFLGYRDWERVDTTHPNRQAVQI